MLNLRYSDGIWLGGVSWRPVLCIFHSPLDTVCDLHRAFGAIRFCNNVLAIYWKQAVTLRSYIEVV